MKVILIKPLEQPKVVELPKNHEYTDIKKMLEISSPLDCIRRKIGKKYYDFWIDDEGLFKEKKYLTCLCENAKEILCGAVMIARHDNKGNTTGLTDGEIESILNPSNYKTLYFKETLSNGVVFELSKETFVAIEDYLGFGEIYSSTHSYILKYRV